MRVSVVIPALNEEATVAEVVRACLADSPYEVLVIDADSTDSTAAEAAAAGATVLNWRAVLADVPPIPGKGESLWRGVAAARGDVVVFVDADLTSARPGMIRALSAPFAEQSVHMVKAHYQRTYRGQPSGGGRVTELTAKPLLRIFYPQLADIRQPLGGEYALRRLTALELPFVGGYGVEIGLLIDLAQRCGRNSIREVDLGSRSHRNRPLEQLGPMADEVARTVVGRSRGSVIAQREPLRSRI